MDIFSLSAAFIAGVLTILSPCILPILPVVFGAATSEHRFGPAALAAGLAISFTALGLFLATVGFSMNFDPDIFRNVSAVLLTWIGIVLLIPSAQAKLHAILLPLVSRANSASESVYGNGISGQFGLGLLLGAVWSPCIGPTLGAATLLASQGEAVFQVAIVMLIFGIGIAIPLLLFGFIGKSALLGLSGKLGTSVDIGKKLLGLSMIAAGLLVITGYDRVIETWMLENGPAWANEWSVRY